MYTCNMYVSSYTCMPVSMHVFLYLFVLSAYNLDGKRIEHYRIGGVHNCQINSIKQCFKNIFPARHICKTYS